MQSVEISDLRGDIKMVNANVESLRATVAGIVVQLEHLMKIPDRVDLLRQQFHGHEIANTKLSTDQRRIWWALGFVMTACMAVIFRGLIG